MRHVFRMKCRHCVWDRCIPAIDPRKRHHVRLLGDFHESHVGSRAACEKHNGRDCASKRGPLPFLVGMLLLAGCVSAHLDTTSSPPAAEAKPEAIVVPCGSEAAESRFAVRVGTPQQWQILGSACPDRIPIRTLFGSAPFLSLVFLPQDGQVPSPIGITFR